MFSATLKPDTRHIEVTLSGTLDETVDLAAAIGYPALPLEINCKGIDRISSDGVRRWIIFFEALKRKGIPFAFSACSIAIVEQLNLISNFNCGGAVRSAYVPFRCPGCRKAAVCAYPIEALKASYQALPTPSCPICKLPVELDDIVEEYFLFVIREEPDFALRRKRRREVVQASKDLVSQMK